MTVRGVGEAAESLGLHVFVERERESRLWMLSGSCVDPSLWDASGNMIHLLLERDQAVLD